MRDRDIRTQLKQQLAAEHADEAGTIICDELEVCRGLSRIDVAMINGQIHGFEIKSASDTLERLPRQVEHYSRLFDTVCLVVEGPHTERARPLIPRWWGLIEARDADGTVQLVRRRKQRPNPSIDPLALAQLLWREEALQLLTDRGLDRGVRTKARRAIAARLAESLPVTELADCVRTCLKLRTDWRSDALRTSGDAKSGPAPTP